MRKLISYIPFFIALALTVTMLYMFALTSLPVYLALGIPCLIACGFTKEYIKE